ncbi:helix-turn-helix domain-containing protein [Enterococcus lemanii]|uniref:Helix-turn-helix domain-containing protein n=1 Tax=Enterococcus lemanii TaxID=1159752 RepID=A0ABV9MWH7_9ENTE|nr:helix-turn-helix domain-containing protein [Enterococcus lemanii]MBM7709357.1 uncharacterized protein YpbB [Enterococcus lemanii]
MDTIILALFQRKHKLKPTTTYHILVGRRSTSILSYAFFNDLLPVFGSFPELKEEDYRRILEQLMIQGKLEKIQSGELRYRAQLEVDQSEILFFDQIDYFNYGKKEAQTWRLIQFLVQVASYYGKSKAYLPLENSPYYLNRTRFFVKQHHSNLRQTIYEELQMLLSELPNDTANFIARSFNGYQTSGAVFFQLLPEEQQGQPWTRLAISARLHPFFKVLENQPTFLMAQFIAPILQENKNQSALQTKRLYKKGLTLEQIGQQRQIKQSTLNDHLLEWALMDETFPYSQFLTPTAYQLLANLPENSWEYAYKELALSENISFFELRLYQIQMKRGKVC